MEGHLRASSKCYHCKKICSSSECLTGLKCSWCGTMVGFTDLSLLIIFYMYGKLKFLRSEFHLNLLELKIQRVSSCCF